MRFGNMRYLAVVWVEKSRQA